MKGKLNPVGCIGLLGFARRRHSASPESSRLILSLNLNNAARRFI
jgi:hypothetical protein